MRCTNNLRTTALRSRRRPSKAIVWGLALAVALLSPGAAAEVSAERVDLYPPEVNLNTKLDYQRVIVVVTRDDGVTRDVTAEAELSLAGAGVARLENHTLYPAGDGNTMLRAKLGDRTVEAPVVVTASGADRPISFKLDVMPVFLRSGCNTGACHGSARGQDGFRLSLFGFDPDGDYHRITREIGFRRINLAIPQESLLLEKAIGAVPHTGGKRFEADSQYYRTLLKWLEAGVPDDAGDVPAVTGIEVYPPAAVLEGADAAQQMIVRANYADGTDRDVSDLAVFLSNNDNSAPVSPEGVVSAAKRGEAFISAKFETKTVGSQVLVLPDGLNYTPPESKPVNYIDELVDAKLRKLRIVPSGICSDEVFLRRVTVDITGLLPTVEQYEAFMADDAPDKRARLIDELLKRKEFAEIWAMKWGELLMVRSTNQLSYKSMFLYSNWLADQIAADVPIDEMVRELLSSTGGTFNNPPTNYYQIERDTLKTAENVAQSFMGIRVQCAQCHNHPFDRWTMDDYYSFAAFFSQIGRKQAEDYREQIIYNRGGGEVRHPVDNRVMDPKFLGGEAPDTNGRDRREVVAEWLTAPDNPYFAPSIANRIWAHFFGIGIIEPVDEMRISNPPSNPELFEALGEKLVEYDYDFKELVRDICNSNTYQRASQPNESNAHDEVNFARSRIRRLRAEVLLDCVTQATETKDKFRGLPLGARAVQVADGSTSNYFLTTFGRSPRETVCACDVKTEPTLSQALHLLNGSTVENKVRSGGVVKRLLDEGKSPEQVVRNLYIRSLCREPDAETVDALLAGLEEGENSRKRLEDTFWALLNSREFLFNH